MKKCERPFYAGANGETWSLVRNGITETICIKHQPTVSTGGEQPVITLQNFLAGHYGPQYDALIQLIRTLLHETLDRDETRAP